jgi:ankyrin repeat protein
MNPLLETLLDAGAAIDHSGAAGNGQYAVNGCLANGRPEAADFLARKGAILDLEGAAGVGRLDVVRSYFNEDGSLKAPATRTQLDRGFVWACEYGQTAVVDFLLDNGADPNERISGMNGLHWAVIGGHLDTIKLLIDRNVSLESVNVYGGTALGAAFWATVNQDEVYRWPGYTDDIMVIEVLLDAGAKIEAGTLEWLDRQNLPAGKKASIGDLLESYGAES